MCKYSLEGYANRSAKKGETLVTNMGQLSDHGVMHGKEELVAQGGRAPLVCVLNGTTLTIENVKLRRGLMQANGTYTEEGRDIVGTRQVVTFVDGRNHRTGWDGFRFADGRYLPLFWAPQGMQVYVGIKPTIEDKVGLSDMSFALDHGPQRDDAEPAAPETVTEADKVKV